MHQNSTHTIKNNMQSTHTIKRNYSTVHGGELVIGVSGSVQKRRHFFQTVTAIASRLGIRDLGQGTP